MLLAAGFIGMMMIALMVLAVTAAAIRIRLAWRRASTRPGLVLECDARQETGFRAPVPRRLPLIECSWWWEFPAHVEADTVRAEDVELITPRRRGAFPLIRRRASIKDALGLASISWTVSEAADVRILPSRGNLDRMTLIEGLGGGEDLSDPGGSPEGDRVDMRQYAAGDSPRTILWKVYAHSRRLLVRVPERAVAAKSRSCAYLIAGPHDEPGAGFLRVVLERGFLGDGWRFGADGCPGFTGRLEEAIDFLVRSGSAPAGLPTGFPEFLERARQDGYAACMLVLPPVAGAWIPAALSALAGTPMRIYTYAVVDQLASEASQPGMLRRVFFLQEKRPMPGGKDLARLASDFAGSPFPLVLVDRQAGRVFGDLREYGPGRREAPGGGR